MTPFRSAARLLLLGAPFIALAAAAVAEAGDADALRGIVQVEKDAGRVSSFRVVEHYRAIGVTAARSAVRASPEADADAARIWAERFCANASRELKWDHRWRLVIYPHGQPHRAFSCVIANTAQRLEPGFSRNASEDPIALDEMK